MNRALGAVLAAALVVALSPLVADGKAHRSQAVLRQFQHEHPCPSTGLKTGACPGWVKDHIVPLCHGGPDLPSNLQWQTVEDAKLKDRWECTRKGRDYDYD
jgi:hypothetical protein